MNNLIDYLTRAGGSDDWRQVGADFVCHTIDHGGSAAEALRAVAAIVSTGLKLTVPLRGDDGRIAASRHLDLGQREAFDVAIGVVWAVAYREGHAAGRAGADDAPRPLRSIGFH